MTAIGDAPDGTNINVGCGATDLRALAELVATAASTSAIAFDGDGDRMLAVDERASTVDGDQILAILALALGVETVAVTSMTNLGFHRLMEERGIRVVTTDVGDRYVLEALRREGGILGGEQSGHIIWLDGHVTGDGLVAALLLCSRAPRPPSLRGRRGHAALPAGHPEPAARRRGPLPDSLLAQVAASTRSSAARAGSRPAFGNGAGRARPRRGRERGGAAEALC